jgi:hypothetical protein
MKRGDFAAAEAKLTKALSSALDHAGAHLQLGIVYIWTKRAAQGIADRGQSKFSTSALAQLGRLDEARFAPKAALALNSNYTISRDRAFWRAGGDDPTYLASLEPFFEGMRKAGVSEQ